MKKTLSLKLTAFIIILLSTNNLFAQQNPSGIDWKSIDTGTYEIIFPAEIAPLGQRVANLMVHYEKYNYSSIKTEARRIPIVLINNYSEPNGFVSFAPFYSHWFTTPSSFDSIEWYKGLAIHEGRHMVQQNKLKDGPGETIWRILLGETGTAYLSIFYVPAWFFEGDSVVMETALTKGGRGRTPYFDLYQRAVEISDLRETYYETFLGSYDSLSPYPDHYRLGYLLCSYVRNHYGNDVWDKILSRTGRYFFWYTFGSALRKETGMTIDQLYTAALNEHRGLWLNQQSELKISDADILTTKNRQKQDAATPFTALINLGSLFRFSTTINAHPWESILYPSADDNGSITAVQFTKTDKLSLVKINEKNETETIKQLPFEVASSFLMNERNLSTGGGFALWREGVPDPRWGYRSYSDLKLLDIQTGRTEFITDYKKYIASAISGDGKTAVGIEYGPDLKYFISVIDTASKHESFREEIKDKGYLFDPAISPDGKNIALAALADEGNAILVYNLESRKITVITGYTHNERFKAPAFYKNYLIYGSDYSGIDNIYAVDIKTGKRFQITSRPLGAYFPSVSKDKLYFSDYSVYGHQAASIILDQKQWVPIEKAERAVTNYIGPVAEKELAGDTDVDNIPDNNYDVNNYYPILNSVNFYGWDWLTPLLFSSLTEFRVDLVSQDVHQTTEIMLSYIHNFNESTNAGEISIIYSGLYPVFSIKGGYGERAQYLIDESEAEDEEIYMTWKETAGSAGISLPLNFSRGIRSTYITFGAEAGYIKITDKNYDDYEIYEDMNYDGELQYMNYYFTFSNLTQTAFNSVSPGTGEILTISYFDTPYDGDYLGNLFTADLALYLPGITDMQGTKISGSYEKVKYETYLFTQMFLFPRGYDSIRHEEFYKGSFDYSFPIANFSANIWKLLYFKRVNGDLFYDYGVGKTNEELYYYRSAGVEITFEHNWLSNKYLALELGVRYSRCFDADENAEKNNDKNSFDIVLKVPI